MHNYGEILKREKLNTHLGAKRIPYPVLKHL